MKKLKVKANTTLNILPSEHATMQISQVLIYNEGTKSAKPSAPLSCTRGQMRECTGKYTEIWKDKSCEK